MKLPFHVEFLNDELARRKRKNPNYSLRAFAYHLEIHPSALCRVLKNKKDISLKSCVLMAKANVFSDGDKIKFLLSVAEQRMLTAAAYLSTACGVLLPISKMGNAEDSGD